MCGFNAQTAWCWCLKKNVSQSGNTDTAVIKAKPFQTHIRLMLICRERHCNILNICYQLSPWISETLLIFLLLWVLWKWKLGSTQWPSSASVCAARARGANVAVLQHLLKSQNFTRRRLFMGHQAANSLMSAAHQAQPLNNVHSSPPAGTWRYQHSMCDYFNRKRWTLLILENSDNTFKVSFGSNERRPCCHVKTSFAFLRHFLGNVQ